MANSSLLLNLLTTACIFESFTSPTSKKYIQTEITPEQAFCASNTREIGDAAKYLPPTAIYTIVIRVKVQTDEH
jgi:hypothetical protein